MTFGLTLALAASLSTAVTPSGVELERVIDNASYQPPGLPGQFFIERTFPLICDGSVLFAGITEFTSGSAIYAATPTGVEVVANEATPVPDSAELFHRAEDPFCDGQRVLFQGGFLHLPHGSIGHSIYSWRRGGSPQLELAAGTHFGPIEAYSYQRAQADGGDIVAEASLRQLGFQAGRGLVLKRPSQPPELILQDFTQVLPGQKAPPESWSGAVLRDGFVYFSTWHAGDWAIYRWSSASGFSRLLDNQAVHPVIGGNFHALGTVAAVEGGLIFGASYAGGDGLFLRRHDGGIEPLLRTGDLTTEGQALQEFQAFQGDAEFFTFYGRTADAPLFVDSVFLRTPDGRIQRILTAGETVDGQPAFALLASARDGEATLLVDHGGPSYATTIYRLALGPAPTPVEVPALSPAAAAILSALLAAGGPLLLRRL